MNGVTLEEGVLDSLERTAREKEGEGEEEAKLATTADLFRYPQTRARWGKGVRHRRQQKKNL